mmetsp:Transcript_36929/g.102578  ORF Transcript_36929/g.102578 Transcript_36929/m.102578 type:complete len:257 (-) Transcript_36929:451-1221(-)
MKLLTCWLLLASSGKDADAVIFTHDVNHGVLRHAGEPSAHVEMLESTQSASASAASKAATRQAASVRRSADSDATTDSMLPALLFSEDLISHELERVSRVTNSTNIELGKMQKSLNKLQEPLMLLNSSSSRDALLLEDNVKSLRDLNTSLGKDMIANKLNALLDRIPAVNDTITQLQGMLGNTTMLERIARVSAKADEPPAAVSDLVLRIQKIEDLLLINASLLTDHAMHAEVDARLVDIMNQVGRELDTTSISLD